MKKLHSLLLILAALLALTLTACGGDEPAQPEEDPAGQEEVQDPAGETPEEEGDTAADPDAGQPAQPQEEKPETGKTEDKPSSQSKPQNNPQSQTKPSTPAPAPAPAPTPEPEPEPEPAPQPSASLGQTLAGAFQAADSSASCQTIADGILANEAVLFAGATMPVTPGLLMGFDDAEITGFSDGVMFAPAIGAIPFVGYVFQLEAGADGGAFCQTLKSEANPRWNVCTEADETIVQQKGDKVFFLMSPTTLEG